MRNLVRSRLFELRSNPFSQDIEPVQSTKTDVKPAYKTRQGGYRIVFRIIPDLNYIFVLILDTRGDVYDEHVIKQNEARAIILRVFFNGKEPAPKVEKVDPRRQRELDRKENNKKKRRGSLEDSLDWLKQNPGVFLK
jgi:mRNA-degrading endonuclease RelE of RelBE toxin-antitoxin system